MSRRLTLILAAACWMFAASVASAAPGDVRVSASLLADSDAIHPGAPFQIGVLLKIDPGWHIYWKNPGDSGMATRLTLQLPAGLTAGAVQYPAPDLLRLPGDILNYVYQDQVMLIVPVTSSADFSTHGSAATTIAAKVRWLVCKDVCLPGSASVQLQLPVSADSAASTTLPNPLFEQWESKMPQPADPANVAAIQRSVDLHPGGSGSAGRASVTIAWKNVPQSIAWFPGPAAGFDVSDPAVNTADGKTVATFTLASQTSAALADDIDCVLTYNSADGKRMALDVPVGRSDRGDSAMAQKQTSP